MDQWDYWDYKVSRDFLGSRDVMGLQDKRETRARGV